MSELKIRKFNQATFDRLWELHESYLKENTDVPALDYLTCSVAILAESARALGSLSGDMKNTLTFVDNLWQNVLEEISKDNAGSSVTV